MEDLIIRSEFENLTEAENEALKKHVPECPDCHKLQQQLANAHYSLKPQSANPLKPRPEIRQNLIRQMSSATNKSSLNIWQKLLSLLEYRIPIYQGVLGMAMIFFIVILLNHFSFSVNPPLSSYSQYAQADSVGVSQMNILNNLSVIESQRIGKSVSEDTMLIKFLHSAM